MKKQKIVYYSDPLNDDFAGTNIKPRPFPERFKYVHKVNFIWKFFEFIFYYLIALPILWCVAKIGYGVKVKGKKNLRGLRTKGYFLYGNHTQIADAWLMQCFGIAPKRGYVLADQSAINMPAIRWLVMMLGCLPIPDLAHKDDFEEAIAYRIKQRRAVIIYPEAHIWPYATHIRPYSNDSFVYPAELGAPTVAFCVTYRKSKLFPHGHPLMTVHVSRPFYPDMTKSIPERKKALRDACYDFMLDYSAEEENVEWISYRQKPKEKEEQKQ